MFDLLICSVLKFVFHWKPTPLFLGLVSRPRGRFLKSLILSLGPRAKGAWNQLAIEWQPALKGPYKALGLIRPFKGLIPFALGPGTRAKGPWAQLAIEWQPLIGRILFSMKDTLHLGAHSIQALLRPL